MSHTPSVVLPARMPERDSCHTVAAVPVAACSWAVHSLPAVAVGIEAVPADVVPAAGVKVARNRLVAVRIVYAVAGLLPDVAGLSFAAASVAQVVLVASAVVPVALAA